MAYDPGPGWHLDWSDEFNGNSLNTHNWSALNSNYDPVTNNCNFGTGELEYPRASNVSVSNGKLIISAQRTGDNPAAPQCQGYGGRSFYSGRIHSKGKVERRYGKLSASIKVPPGYGMWPAFWTLGANIDGGANAWPKSGEIDIMEWKSTEPSWMKSAIHWYNGGQADLGYGRRPRLRSLGRIPRVRGGVELEQDHLPARRRHRRQQRLLPQRDRAPAEPLHPAQLRDGRELQAWAPPIASSFAPASPVTVTGDWPLPTMPSPS